MFGLGPLEILVILVLALLIFGRRLPEIGKGVGKSIVEFKKGLAGMEDELRIDNPSSTQPSNKQLHQNTTTTQDAASTQTRVPDQDTPSQPH